MFKLILPEGFHFECARCGECCRGWGIPVSDKDQEMLVREGVGGRRELFVKPRSSGTRFLRMKDDACILQNDGGGCGIYYMRPGVCRSYPLRLKDTPDGVFIGVSYSCPSISYKRGRPLAELEDYIMENVVNTSTEPPVGDDIPLYGDVTLRWGGYLALERELMRFLAEKSIEDGLMAGFRLIEYVSSKLSYGLSAGREEVQSIMNVFFDKGFDEISDDVCKNGLPVQHRLTLSVNLLPAETEGNLLSGVLGIIKGHLRFFAGSGKLSFKTKPNPFNLSDLKKVEYSFGDGESHVREYLNHAVFRKDLLRGLNLNENYRMLVLSYALFKWYTVLNAHSGSRTKPSLEDVVEAVRTVERNHALHSGRFARMSSSRITAPLHKRYIHHRLYAPTMIYSSPWD